FDAVRQIAGHALTQVATAEQQEHARSLFRKKHDGLSSRIPAADHNDLRASTELQLGRRSRLVDAQTLELLAHWHVQLAILGPRRDQHTSSRDVLAIVEPENGIVILKGQACN